MLLLAGLKKYINKQMNNFGVISRGAVRLIAGEIGELQRNSQPFCLEETLWRAQSYSMKRVMSFTQKTKWSDFEDRF